MARQASSKMGGLFGVVLAIIVVVAIVGTPFYIGLLQTDHSATSAKTLDDIQLVRRAVMNLDESLAQLKTARVTSNDSAADVSYEISADAKQSLQQTTSMLQQVAQRDRDRGTTIDGKTIAMGTPNANSVTAIMRQYEQTLAKAKTAIGQLQSESGTTDIAGKRAAANLSYVEGRLEKSRGEYLQWQASRNLDRATQLVGYLREYGIDRAINNGVASSAAADDGIIAATAQRIAQADTRASELSAQLAQLQATISDYNHRIDTLESTARNNRLQMADMQARRQAIHGENSAYDQLASGARDAEARAEALRFGTLNDAEVVITGLDSIEDTEYRGGTPAIGLLSLENMGNNVRAQLSDVEAEKSKLAEQLQYYETMAAGSDAVAAQASEEITAVATDIEQLIDGARTHQSEAEKAFDKSLTAFQNSINVANRGAMNVNAWKNALTVEDAPAESGAAALNQMIKSDGDLEGTLRALAGDAAYQRAVIYSSQIDLALRMQGLNRLVAKLTESEIPNEFGERIELWRGNALEALTKAENAYQQAGNQLARSQVQVDGKTIRGADYKWQAQFGEAAVHILRANLLTELANRQAEKDKAYEILKGATEGREQSDLLTPAVEAIKQLQSNPS